MALSAKLTLRQGQTMVLTPQLLQAIKLLQMPTVELSAFIENELASNPLLERAEDGERPSLDPLEAAPAEAEPETGAKPGDWALEALRDRPRQARRQSRRRPGVRRPGRAARRHGRAGRWPLGDIMVRRRGRF